MAITKCNQTTVCCTSLWHMIWPGKKATLETRKKVKGRLQGNYRYGKKTRPLCSLSLSPSPTVTDLCFRSNWKAMPEYTNKIRETQNLNQAMPRSFLLFFSLILINLFFVSHLPFHDHSLWMIELKRQRFPLCLFHFTTQHIILVISWASTYFSGSFLSPHSLSLFD